MNLKDLWLAIIRDLEKDINRANVITWFKNTALLSSEDGLLTIGLPLPVFLNWHAQNYAGKTLKAAQDHDPSVKQIAYEVDLTLSESDPRVIDLLSHFPEKESRKLPNKQEMKLKGGVVSKMFNPRYSLDTFVVAPENRLAHAASMTVSKYPGQNYNPLFIYGGVGLGKTHLLQSIGREVLRNDPNKVVVYTTTEDFTNELISGIKSGNMNKFRNKYRKVDVFIIDDIQFIANKDRTQEEFFHTFNTLYEAGKQVVISSDRPPHELTLLSDRLVSRFESGMSVDVKMPDYESRLVILKNKCQEAQVFINDQVLEFIAFNIDNSVRALIGVLNQVIAEYELEHTAPTIKSVSEIIKRSKKEVKMVGFIKDDPTPRQAVTMDQLTDYVSEYYTIPKSEVLGESRNKEVLIPRQLIMYLAKTRLRMSLAKIGQSLGNRNHTTVMHAISKVQNLLKNDRQLLYDTNAIIKEAGIH
ncbi:chromosomal replication initiator protein DnaA [Candidatus Peregrinibacteria bacterium]|nr:chromosomal replication initiator protein DnaA [Candidatus Peregrinibacteria bacterium]